MTDYTDIEMYWKYRREEEYDAIESYAEEHDLTLEEAEKELKSLREEWAISSAGF